MYNKLMGILNKGDYVVLVNNKDEYNVFSPPNVGRHSGSGWHSSSELAKQNVGRSLGYYRSQFESYSEKYDWRIVEIYKPNYIRHKVGDIVTVLDCENYVKGCSMWNEAMAKLIGENCEVKSLHSGMYYIYTPDKMDFWPIPEQFVVSVFEDDEVKKAIKLLEDRGILIDGKVLK